MKRFSPYILHMTYLNFKNKFIKIQKVFVSFLFFHELKYFSTKRS